MSYQKFYRPNPIEPAAVPSLDEIESLLASSASLPDRIYGHLKRDLLTGKLKPGSRMVEKNLCERFGVSRTPLRESLNRLAHEGLLLLRKNCGFTAAPVDAKAIERAADLRLQIEPCLVRGLAQNHAASPEAEFKVKMVAEGEDETDELCRANAAFHGGLVRQHGNALLTSFLMRAIDRFHLAIYLAVTDFDLVEEERDHQAIQAAIEAGDASAAEQLMRAHIERASKSVLSHYS